MTIESIQAELDVLEENMSAAGRRRDFAAYDLFKAQRSVKRDELVTLVAEKKVVEGGSND